MALPAQPLDYGEVVEIEPTGRHTASVIFLHGLGDNGNNVSRLASVFSSLLGRHARFVFPTAPVRPITMQGGEPATAWFDLSTSWQLLAKGEMDGKGVAASVEYVSSLIQAELRAGVLPSRIVLAGFSMGGHVALKAGLNHECRLGGIVALSTWLEPLAVLTCRSKALPIFLGHGKKDPLVLPFLYRVTKTTLKLRGLKPQSHCYPDMGHSISAQELKDLGAFLAQILPPTFEIERTELQALGGAGLKHALQRRGISAAGMLERAEMEEALWRSLAETGDEQPQPQGGIRRKKDSPEVRVWR